MSPRRRRSTSILRVLLLVALVTVAISLWADPCRRVKLNPRLGDPYLAWRQLLSEAPSQERALLMDYCAVLIRQTRGRPVIPRLREEFLESADFRRELASVVVEQPSSADWLRWELWRGGRESALEVLGEDLGGRDGAPEVRSQEAALLLLAWVWPRWWVPLDGPHRHYGVPWCLDQQAEVPFHQQCLALLESPDEEVRLAAALFAARMDYRRANPVPALERTLEDGSSSVRSMAAWSIAYQLEPLHTEYLSSRWADSTRRSGGPARAGSFPPGLPEPTLRGETLPILRRMLSSTERPDPILLGQAGMGHLARDPERLHAARLLPYLGVAHRGEALSLLQPLLEDDDPGVRDGALRAVGSLLWTYEVERQPIPMELAPALAELLTEPDRAHAVHLRDGPRSTPTGLCHVAVLALGRVGAPADLAVPALHGFLQHRCHAETRALALLTLAGYGPGAQEVEGTLHRLEDEWPRHRIWEIRIALASIQGDDLTYEDFRGFPGFSGNLGEPWGGIDHLPIRMQLQAISPVLRMLASPSPEARLQGMWVSVSFRAIPVEVTVPFLVLARYDPDDMVRSHVCQCLRALSQR